MKRSYPTIFMILITLGLASCRDEDAAKADLKSYCKNVLAIETIDRPLMKGFEDLRPERQATEAKRFVGEKLRPLASKILEVAPTQIQPEVKVLREALMEIETTGNFKVLGKPEVAQAAKGAHAFDLKNCRWSKVSVAAQNYAFRGVPASLKAGPTNFELKNNSIERHEMLIFKRSEGVAKSFDDLLELSKQEAEEALTFVGSDDASAGGGSGYLIAKLTPGKYAMVCMVPVGSTREALKAAAASERDLVGPPHLARGMKTEFTVE